MNVKDPERVLDEISREQLPQDLNLLPGILAKVQQGRRSTMFTTRTFRFSAVLVAAILLIALFSLPGAVSALRALVGFIPGVGRVDQSIPLRVLADPITDTRDGYTIYIDGAVLDAARTVLNYRVAGDIPTVDDPALMTRTCRESSTLRLPDGSELRYPSRERVFGDGVSHWKDTFQAVPAGVDSAVLVLPCLAELPAGAGPQNWEIPLRFAPAPPEMRVFPVVEIHTPQPEHGAVATDSAPSNGMRLTLEGVAALEEGYYLQTRLHWDQEFDAAVDVQIFPDGVHLYDARGQEVAVAQSDPGALSAAAEKHSIALDLLTVPIHVPGPAKLVVDYVGLRMFPTARFTLDVGSDPQPGQTWEINKDLDINGCTLRVISAEYIQAEPGEPAMLMLYLSADSDVLAFTALDPDHELLGIGGSPNSEFVTFRTGWYYKDGFPSGIINIESNNIIVRHTGPWSLTWTPPEGSVQYTPEPSPVTGERGICQDQIPAKEATGVLPPGLGGRAAYGVGGNYEMYVANVDGSHPTALGAGLMPDLTAGGQRVVYRGLEGGIFVRDLEQAEARLVSGAIQENVFDIRPRWSPDGRTIAFDRVIDHAADIYRVNADGSGLRAILAGPEDESLLGWSPDGQKIIYRVTTAEGISVRVLDMAANHSAEVALLPMETMQISLAPDGLRMVYVEARGIFLMALDHSMPTALIGSPHEFGNPVWSPDSQWIALASWDLQDNSNPPLALLQPDTCQFIRLDVQLGDILTSWVR